MIKEKCKEENKNGKMGMYSLLIRGGIKRSGKPAFLFWKVPAS
jgi:hypothetical protein